MNLSQFTKFLNLKCVDWDKNLHSEAQNPRFDLLIPRFLCLLKIFRFLGNFNIFKIRSFLILDVFVHVIIFFRGTSQFLGPYEMVTGEWKYSIITGGSFSRKMGSFFKGWSYGCSHGYG